MKFTFVEPRASKPERQSPGIPLPPPTRSGLERLCNLFGLTRYVQVQGMESGLFLTTTPAEAEAFVAALDWRQRIRFVLRDVYLTPAAFEALRSLET